MAVSDKELNRFERTLFRIALLLTGLLIVARLGSMIVIAFLRHTR